MAYSETNKVANFLAKGIANKLVGKATTNPIIHPCRNLCRNPEVQPVFIEVIVKVNVVSKAKVIKKATNNPEYFMSNFKTYDHPSRFFNI